MAKGSELQLDEIDYKIIKVLSKDARVSYRDLGRKIGISATTVFLRVSKLLKEGVLKGFVSLVDLEKLGWDISVAICIKVRGGHLEKVENEIAKIPNVCAVYDITGEWDSLVIAKFKSRMDLNKFVKSLLSMHYVEHTCTYTMLNNVKEELYADVL